MKLLRLTLVLLLTLALPFAGTAAVGMPMSSPCPMQSGMSHRMEMSAGHDCCQSSADSDPSGPSAKAKSSSSCKAGQECQFGNLAAPVQATLGVHPLAAPPVLTVAPDTVVSSRDPSGLWRPPPSL